MGFENGEFDFYEMLNQNFGLGMESLKHYAIGGVVGELGFALKEHSGLKDVVTRTIIKKTFLQSMQLIQDAAQKRRE